MKNQWNNTCLRALFDKVEADPLYHGEQWQRGAWLKVAGSVWGFNSELSQK